MQRGDVILVDTNIIIEAVRIGCWSALRSTFRVETVEKCREEARTGNQRRAGYVTVDDAALRDDLAVHAVTDMELASLGLACEVSTTLDAGERHLWAHAFSRQGAWFATCCDRAAVRVAINLRWEDKLVSLEELVRVLGTRATLDALKDQFRTATLSGWRTDAILARGLR
jgi:hypothetical protein